MNELIINTQTNNFYNFITTRLNKCNSFIFNVAFINYSGLQLLLDVLKTCEEKGIKGKVLTSTYLNFTQVKALEKLREFKNIELKIYDSNLTGFHAKAYIFEFDKNYEVVIGSSNITASAFKSNIEWNVKTIINKEDEFFFDINSEFEKLWNESIYVNDSFIEEYEKFQKQESVTKKFVYEKSISANYMQKKALEKLEFLRESKQKKALAIAATGSGKTYLAALDVKAYNPKKFLFIVHRENILLKAKESFEKICQKEGFLYTGNKKQKGDYLFATIQSLSINLNEFLKDEFDYIVVDEAHHIASPSYKKVLDYFTPNFLLGLTATPNRSDDANIYEFFDENIACDIRLNDALEENLITPFHYYGLSDIKQLDYEKIDINKIEELAKFLMVNKRVDYIVEKLNFYGNSAGKRKSLGFCASKEHARYMSEEFNKRGIQSVYLTSEDSVSFRQECIENLENEENPLEVIFSVDIFNEGIDIPSVNSVMMLRPTNSPIIFLQQLGRGLRKYKNKEFLTLLDFIGNHNRTYQIAIALLGNKTIDKDSIKLNILNNFANLKNVHIYMDEISKQRVLDQVEKENFNSFKYLKEQYLEFKDYIKRRPKLVDYISNEEYVNPLKFISDTKSYFEFIIKVEKDEKLKSFASEEFIKAIRFIDGLLPIKRVYEFVILKLFLENYSLDEKKVFIALKKYLKIVDKDTISHAFRFLEQEFYDSGQKSRLLKLIQKSDNKYIRTKEFDTILRSSDSKSIIEDSLEYGLLVYENSFSIEDYGLPFLKKYEKYNMLNIAQLCNFNKIHSSFRGSGFLKFKDDFFLFMTLEKDKFQKGYSYSNFFSSKSQFKYFSKPSHSFDKGDGYRLVNNKKEGVKLHIFVRKFSHVDKKTQGFIYLGLANTISFKDNKPIECQMKLEVPLSNQLFEEFTKVV